MTLIPIFSPDYALAPIANAVPASSATPTTIATFTLPTVSATDAAALSLFFNLYSAAKCTQSHILPGINATSVGQFLYPPGGVTSPYYLTNSSNFGYGGSNIPGGATFNAYGLVVIVPAIGTTAVQVGVSASLYAL